MSGPTNDLVATFLEEAQEHLQALEDGLLTLENGDADPDLLNAIFRAAHSIKGGSGIVGLMELMRFTHAFENVLGKLRDGKLQTDASLTTVLLQGLDILRLYIAEAQGETADLSTMPDVRADLEMIVAAIDGPVTHNEVEFELWGDDGVSINTLEGLDTTSLSPQQRWWCVLRGTRALLDADWTPERHFALSHIEICSMNLDRSNVPPLADLDPSDCHLTWVIQCVAARTQAELQHLLSADGLFEVEVAAALQEGERPVAAETAAQSPASSRAVETPAEASAPTQAAVPEQSSAAPKPEETKKAEAATKPTQSDKGKANAPEASIRVATAKIDELMNVVGELVIAQSMVNEAVRNFSMDRLPQLMAAVSDMERNTRDLQERVMGVRMVPVATAFSRFPRLVRDMSAQLGKKIAVELAGEDTELDKSLIEKLADPLTHLVRNSLDHGLEPPEERLAAGKSEQGTVKLQAYTEGGAVVIEVSDDGRGLNRQRILDKALKEGIITAGQELSEDEINALIFAPGFSTAAKVTDVSGRGVGMDVVKRNIESLNGTVRLTTRPGKGTSFKITLPLTLAIMDGLSLKVSDQVFVVPLLSIIESIPEHRAHIKKMLGKGEVIMLRGESIPLLRPRSLFHIDDTPPPQSGIVVVVEDHGRQFALLVDSLLGQSQVVVKSLEANYARVDGLMGATIMGDGHVALILDVAGLVQLSRRHEKKTTAEEARAN